MQKNFDQLNQEMTALSRKDCHVTSKEVQSVIQRHFDLINRFYVPTKEVYSGLGQLYVDHPELAVFYRDSMKHYAEENP